MYDVYQVLPKLPLAAYVTVLLMGSGGGGEGVGYSLRVSKGWHGADKVVCCGTLGGNGTSIWSYLVDNLLWASLLRGQMRQDSMLAIDRIPSNWFEESSTYWSVI